MGGLAAPIFNQGTLKNSKRIATAAQLNAFYNYQQHIVQGYQQFSTQLSAINNYNGACQLKKKELQELREALSTANDLYLTGYANYMEVIVAQRSVLSADLKKLI